jgi:hypothetical protein
MKNDAPSVSLLTLFVTRLLGALVFVDLYFQKRDRSFARRCSLPTHEPRPFPRKRGKGLGGEGQLSQNSF